jgi:hypothetical protein
MNATMQDKLIAAGVVAPPAPKTPPPSPPPRREVKLINPVPREAKQSALSEAQGADERTFDLVHHDYVEKRRNRDGVEFERRTLVYERYTYKSGRLEAYLYSDPRMGLTAEEREIMFGSARTQRKTKE